MNWSDHLTRIRRFLRDPNGNIWSDEYLLRMFNDEQNSIQTNIGQVEDARVVIIPPHYQMAYFWDWEWPYNDHADGEVFQPGYYDDGHYYVTTNIWEHEHLDIVTPTTPSYGEFYTQPWEVWCVSTPCEPPAVSFPDGFYRAKFVAWDRKPLEATTLKELQDSDITWKTRQGDPVSYYRDENLSNNHYLYPLPSSVSWKEYRLWTELVTDGDFNSAENWTLGDGWSISGGVASSDGTQSAASNLTQSAILTDATKYRIEFTVSGLTAGTVKVYAGSGTAGTSRSADGTYTEYLTCATSTDFIIAASSTFVGSVSNVSVRAITYDVATIDTDPDDSDYGTTTLDVDDNLLVIFDKNTTDLADTTDESVFPKYFHKFIEYGVVSRAYGANTDGRIRTLSDYWALRKDVGIKTMKRFLARRRIDRNYRLQPAWPKPIRSRSHPRLPSEYPEI